MCVVYFSCQQSMSSSGKCSRQSTLQLRPGERNANALTKAYLPPEILVLIIQKLYKDIGPTLCNCDGTLHLHGCPPTNIELVCRALTAEARDVRSKMFPHHLAVTAYNLPGYIAGEHGLLSSRFSSLRQHVRSLEVPMFSENCDHSWREFDWELFLGAFPRLQYLRLTRAFTSRFLVNSLTGVHDVPAQPHFVQHIMAGSYDRDIKAHAILSKDSLMQAPSQRLDQEYLIIDVLVSISFNDTPALSQAFVKLSDGPQPVLDTKLSLDPSGRLTVVGRSWSTATHHTSWSRHMSEVQTRTLEDALMEKDSLVAKNDPYSDSMVAFAVPLEMQASPVRWFWQRSQSTFFSPQIPMKKSLKLSTWVSVYRRIEVATLRELMRQLLEAASQCCLIVLVVFSLVTFVVLLVLIYVKLAY